MVAGAWLLGCVVGPSHAGELECPGDAVPVSGTAIDWGHSKALGVASARWCEKDGKRQGPYEDFYPSGQVFRRVSFQHGKKNGPMMTYYESGDVWSERRYEDDQLTGKSTQWHPNGQVAEISEYSIRGDDVWGTFESWDDRGTRVATGELLNGKPHGTMVVYDRNGNPADVVEYLYGVEIRSGPALPDATPE